MKNMLVVFSLLALHFPASALGQQDGQDTQKVTEYEFNGMKVSADLKMPLGERIEAEHQHRSKSLYQTRQNWVPELLESSREL